jgi:EpsI family protein
MRSLWVHYWSAMALLAAAAPLPGYLGHNEPVPLRRPLDQLSYQIGEWQGHDEELSASVREKLGTNDLLMRRYVDPRGDIVLLYVSYFERQQQGEISHSPKNCLPGAGWQPMVAHRVPYPVANAGTGMVNEIVFDKSGQKQLVYYWFQERNRVLASEYLVKLYLIWDAVTRHHTDGALLRVSAVVRGSEEETRAYLSSFMGLALPEINQFFPSAERET